MNNEITFITKSISGQEDKLMVSNSLFEPDHLNGECIGYEFGCIGYLIRPVEINGKELIGVILFSEDEESYSTVSSGVSNIVCNWANIGFEPSRENPVMVKYEQVRKGSRSYYTIKLVKNKKGE